MPAARDRHHFGEVQDAHTAPERPIAELTSAPAYSHNRRYLIAVKAMDMFRIIAKFIEVMPISSRVFVDIDRMPPEIVTVYWTSRIEK
jgi:hypothetical protein